MDEDIRKEKLIKDAIDPVSLGVTKNIVYQMEKCVCKIYNNGETGTGFFTKIPYKDESLLVLMTNNHVLGEKDIQNDKIITISISNNGNDKKFIKINNKRKRYTNEKLDVTIIEIDENKDNIHDYIKLDKDIINSMNLNKEEIIDNYKNIYKNKSIYLLNYLQGENIVVSYGLLSEINEINGIIHKCKTDKGSSGSPILSLKNNKLIGIHLGSSVRSDFNMGTLIIYPIKEFQNIINNILIIKKCNEISIKYNIKDENRIRLFGSKFIENNKNNCKIIIENKEQEIIEYLDITEYKIKNKELLEIKLREIKTITDMSHMFNKCSLLSSLPDISKWDTKDVTNMSYMFYLCESLTSLPDISKWDTKKVTDMSHMFNRCSLLSSLPDISKWDTKNVTNMGNMFYGCKSLTSLPDFSKWYIKENNGMFWQCSSLLTNPNIDYVSIINIVFEINGKNKNLFFQYGTTMHEVFKTVLERFIEPQYKNNDCIFIYNSHKIDFYDNTSVEIFCDFGHFKKIIVLNNYFY